MNIKEITDRIAEERDRIAEERRREENKAHLNKIGEIKNQKELKKTAGIIALNGVCFLGVSVAEGIILGVLLLSVGLLAAAGVIFCIATKKSTKWKKYESLINHTGNTDLNAVAATLGCSYMNACGDIQEMIDKEFFIGPNCDIEAVIVHDKQQLVMYRNGAPISPIVDLMSKDKTEEAAEADSTQAYIDSIREAINVVEDEEVKDTLYDLEGSIRRILAKTRKRPELLRDTTIIKLKATYLPETVKLIEAYTGEMISPRTARAIKSALVTCSEAFGNIDKELCESDDISTLADIDVLRTTFARDGMLNSDFDV